MECLADLRKNLMRRGLNLLIRSGKPEDILPSLAKDFGAHTVKSFLCACAETFRSFLKMLNFCILCFFRCLLIKKRAARSYMLRGLWIRL